MTEEEIEKQAEEYAIINYGTEDVVQSNLLQSIAKASFQDGAKWMQEKLKCCGNCKNVHYEWGEKVIEGVCHECRNYNKWELGE